MNHQQLSIQIYIYTWQTNKVSSDFSCVSLPSTLWVLALTAYVRLSCFGGNDRPQLCVQRNNDYVIKCGNHESIQYMFKILRFTLSPILCWIKHPKVLFNDLSNIATYQEKLTTIFKLTFDAFSESHYLVFQCINSFFCMEFCEI